MIKQGRHYIQLKKKKFLSIALLCALFILLLMIIGLYITRERANLFTIAAGLMVIPCAQNLTRFLSFNRFKDADEHKSMQLDAIKGNLSIYHSGIIIHERHTLYVDHIVLTSKHTYLLCEKEEDYQNIKKYALSSLTAKGIQMNQIVLRHIKTKQDWDHLICQIEKEAILEECLERKETIMEGILM